MCSYGGIYERGSREYTLDDFYSLQLDKLDRFVCLKESGVVIPAEGEDDSSSEDDEDDGEDSDEDEEPSDEETIAEEDIDGAKPIDDIIINGPMSDQEEQVSEVVVKRTQQEQVSSCRYTLYLEILICNILGCTEISSQCFYGSRKRFHPISRGCDQYSTSGGNFSHVLCTLS